MVVKKLSVREEEFKKFNITEEQFGPVMLSRLGKGLYKNSLHCVREYIQNAVDGINKFNREFPDDPTDKIIRIQAEGDTIIFHDNGIGMNKEDILTAISFGVSLKERIYDAGFLGIGIFSGAAIADRLRIYTTKKDEVKALVFEIDFKYIDKNYKEYTSGLKLLRDATQFQEVDEDENKHYCEATLYVNKEYRSLLKNDAEIRRYISNVCPVDFPDEFEYKPIITDFYKKYEIEDQIFDIRLNKIPVYRPFPTKVKEPEFKEVIHKGKRLAVYWYCENKKKGVIEGKEKKNEDDIRYITYRWRNFLIDDPDRRDYAARELFRGRPELMKNYFGDIHILDLEDIEPDLERTGVRHTDTYKQFKGSIRDRKNPNNILLLYDQAHDVSKQKTLMKEVEKVEEICNKINERKLPTKTEELYKKKFEIEEQKKNIMKRKRESRGRAYDKLSTPEKQKVEKSIKKLEKKEKKIEKHIVESQKDRTKPKEPRFDSKIEIKIEQVLRILKRHLKNHATLYNAIIKDLEALVKGK